MTLPLRPAIILRRVNGPAGSIDLTILCADSRQCSVTVGNYWATPDGIALAVERTVVGLEHALDDARAALASWGADMADPFTDA